MSKEDQESSKVQGELTRDPDATTPLTLCTSELHGDPLLRVAWQLWRSTAWLFAVDTQTQGKVVTSVGKSQSAIVITVLWYFYFPFVVCYTFAPLYFRDSEILLIFSNYD